MKNEEGTGRRVASPWSARKAASDDLSEGARINQGSDGIVLPRNGTVLLEKTLTPVGQARRAGIQGGAEAERIGDKSGFSGRTTMV
ncbi:MAG: hypothetical protein O7H41_19850 [Planctomycetota bacterium]|nr:hypothetical protein [Planctomycetota bacterium]